MKTKTKPTRSKNTSKLFKFDWQSVNINQSQNKLNQLKKFLKDLLSDQKNKKTNMIASCTKFNRKI